MEARLLHPVKGPLGSNSQVGGPYPWQQNQLTDAHYHKGSHPIEDAQVLDTEDHMVQEECHQATEADAGNPEEGQEHCAGQAAGDGAGDPTEHRLSVSLAPAGTCLTYPHPQGHLHHPIQAQYSSPCPEKVPGRRPEYSR